MKPWEVGIIVVLGLGAYLGAAMLLGRYLGGRR